MPLCFLSSMIDLLRLFHRSREFLWQEGHTAFATKEEADKEVHIHFLLVRLCRIHCIRSNLHLAVTPHLSCTMLHLFQGQVFLTLIGAQSLTI
jgi:hypothetical protein